MIEDSLSPDNDGTPRSITDERRASVRFPSHLGTPVLATGLSGGPAEQARVRDVSSFGLGLIVPQRLEFGTQLLVDLENATRGVVHSVLVRVVHTTQQPEGDWLIGCALIGEMNDSGLNAFQANCVRPANADCRAWIRYPCNLETICHTTDSLPGETLPARIINVSAGGVGLMLPCQFETKTILRLQLPGPHGQQPPRLLVRVVQSRAHGHGNWYLGCEFVDCLHDDEVAILSGP